VTTLPASLVRFEQELEHAIRRERTQRRRGIALRGSVAVAVAGAVALGVLGALPRTGPSVVERAAAALRVADGTILHTVLVGTLDAGTGRETVEVRIERWQASSPPYDQLQIIRSGDRRFEVATVDGAVQLYDPKTNTIYTHAAEKSEKTAPATAGSGVKRGTVVADGDSYRTKILGLLESGKVHEAGRITVDGRAAIRLASDDGSVALLVDADGYEPIEWRVSEGGQTAVTSFPTYERLAATEVNAALLSLTQRHPDATVDDDPSHYRAAFERLNPTLR
jgi:hypothetical protein